MHGFPADGDAPKSKIAEIAKIFVVVAGYVDHPRSLARLSQDLLDYVIVGLIPVPGFAQGPIVNKVPHDVERVALGVFEKLQKLIRLCTPGAEMNVRYP